MKTAFGILAFVLTVGLAWPILAQEVTIYETGKGNDRQSAIDDACFKALRSVLKEAVSATTYQSHREELLNYLREDGEQYIERIRVVERFDRSEGTVGVRVTIDRQRLREDVRRLWDPSEPLPEPPAEGGWKNVYSVGHGEDEESARRDACYNALAECVTRERGAEALEGKEGHPIIDFIHSQGRNYLRQIKPTSAYNDRRANMEFRIEVREKKFLADLENVVQARPKARPKTKPKPKPQPIPEPTEIMLGMFPRSTKGIPRHVVERVVDRLSSSAETEGQRLGRVMNVVSSADKMSWDDILEEHSDIDDVCYYLIRTERDDDSWSVSLDIRCLNRDGETIFSSYGKEEAEYIVDKEEQWDHIAEVLERLATKAGRSMARRLSR